MAPVAPLTDHSSTPMDLRVSAYAIIVDDRGMLLAHWVAGDRSGWTLPGGGLEPGEDPADAATREVLEETGYEVILDELLAIDSFILSESERFAIGGPDLQNLRIIYRAHVVGGELRDEVNGSTDTAGWFDSAVVDASERVALVDTGRRAAGLIPSPD